jgi:hypothetical protein
VINGAAWLRARHKIASFQIGQLSNLTVKNREPIAAPKHEALNASDTAPLSDARPAL